MSASFPLHVWLVDTDDGQPVAFASDSLYEFVPDSELLPVPGAALPFTQVMEWLQDLVPVLCHSPVISKHAQVLLVHTTPTTGTALLGLQVACPPQRLVIYDDSMAGFKLAHCGLWQKAAISGFLHQGRSVPLLDPDRLC